MSILTTLMLMATTAQAGKFKEVETTRTWDKAPMIGFCTESTTSVATMKNVMKFWRSKGYDIKGIDPHPVDCEMNPPRGYILIDGLGRVNTDDEYGLTSPWFYGTSSRYAYVVISVNPQYANNEKVLIHEVGHGLGLTHSEQIGHIMYKYIFL